jgi:hypothetical protein
MVSREMFGFELLQRLFIDNPPFAGEFVELTQHVDVASVRVTRLGGQAVPGDFLTVFFNIQVQSPGDSTMKTLTQCTDAFCLFGGNQESVGTVNGESDVEFHVCVSFNVVEIRYAVYFSVLLYVIEIFLYKGSIKWILF